MAAPSYTYSLTNGTTADASQVMQNYNDILNGVTDGTKDLSISALTCAGTATLNGNVNIGNASGDDLTITASLASSIAIKTTNTYAIGSSSLVLSNIYSTLFTGPINPNASGGNTLSNYVEGTFTPVLKEGANTLTCTASGKYTRIGNVVKFNIAISAITKSGVGAITITSMPITSSSTSTYNFAALSRWSLPASTTHAYAYTAASSTVLELYWFKSGDFGASAISANDMANATTSGINISGFYYA